MALTLTLSERKSGVPISTATVPPAIALSPQTGTNDLQVTWTLASGGTASEQVELHVVLDQLSSGHRLRFMDITWGDGDISARIPVQGRSVDYYESHTYISGTAKTITVEIVTKVPDDIVFNETLNFTPSLSADFLIDQVQIERYRNEVLDYAPDWKAPANVPLVFLNDTRRGLSHRYRVRFRTLDPVGSASTTSSFSSSTSQSPWI